jgi:hypothetical protein
MPESDAHPYPHPHPHTHQPSVCPACLLLPPCLQEDFEMSVAKVMKKDTDKNMSIKKLWK